MRRTHNTADTAVAHKTSANKKAPGSRPEALFFTVASSRSGRGIGGRI